MIFTRMNKVNKPKKNPNTIESQGYTEYEGVDPKQKAEKKENPTPLVDSQQKMFYNNSNARASVPDHETQSYSNTGNSRDPNQNREDQAYEESSTGSNQQTESKDPSGYDLYKDEQSEQTQKKSKHN